MGSVKRPLSTYSTMMTDGVGLSSEKEIFFGAWVKRYGHSVR